MAIVCRLLTILQRANFIHATPAPFLRQLRNEIVKKKFRIVNHLLLLLGHHLPLGEEDLEVEEEDEDQGDEEGAQGGVHNVAWSSG